MDEQLEEELGYEAQSLNHEAQREQVISDLQGHIAELQSENKRLREALSRMFEQHFLQTNAIFKQLAGFDRCVQDMTEQALKNK